MRNKKRDKRHTKKKKKNHDNYHTHMGSLSLELKVGFQKYLKWLAKTLLMSEDTPWLLLEMTCSEMSGRSSSLPEGSPRAAVASPITQMAWCPSLTNLSKVINTKRFPK